MIQYDYKTVHDEEFQLIPDARKGCWMHVEEATSDDMALVAEKLGLEVSDLQDCLDKYRA